MRLDQIVAAAVNFGRGAAGDAVVAWRRRMVYVLSYDRTVLLRVTGVTPVRDDEVVFRACDYEGPLCSMEGLKVIFKIADNAAVEVPRPSYSFEGLDALFERLRPDPVAANPSLFLSDRLLAVIDDGLPHVEFTWQGHDCIIRQRDIYTGKLLTIRAMPNVHADTDPLAIRTADLLGLFKLGKTILLERHGSMFHATDGQHWSAMVGGCLYDAMGRLEIAKGVADGRQE